MRQKYQTLALLDALLMVLLDLIRNRIKQRPLTWVLATGLTLFLVGWMVFGWVVWPVEYVNLGYAGLPYGEQANYVLTVADLYSFTHDADRVGKQLGYWGGDRVACYLSTQVPDPFQAIRLQAAAYTTTGQPCGVVYDLARGALPQGGK